MINPNLEVKQEIRDRKYFDQFSYAVKFTLAEVAVLRTLDHARIDQIFETQQFRLKNWGGSWASLYQRPVTAEIKHHCHSFCDYLLSRTKCYKLLISDIDTGNYYTDHISEINSLINLSFISEVKIKQAELSIPRNSILLKKSDYKYRTYLRNQSLDQQQLQNAKQFLSSRQDVRLSPSLSEWANCSYKYIYDNFFIDHNDVAFVTLLTLASSLQTKKTVDIILDK